MLAVVAHGAGDLRVEHRDEPVPGPGEVAVAVRYGGICGSDLHYYRHGAVGDFRLREPLVLGHEVVGTVDGTPVAVHPGRSCGECGQCLRGSRHLCVSGGYLGSAARFPHVQGGFAGTLVVPAESVRPLPTGLDLRRAAVAEPAAVAWHAVARAGDVRGRRVLVTGAGPIGCLVVAALRAAGAGEIVVTDLHPGPLRVAEAVGATATQAATEPVEHVEADVAVESSGSPAGLTACLRGVERGGLVVALGLLPPGDSPVAANLIVTRELRVTGSFRFGAELDDVLPALADGRLAVDPVVTSVLPATAAREAFELAADPARSCKVLLDFRPGG
ncbi:L-idonate 5-dehydrogenase [Amycolatopsis suaedae]|uniref:L-idonate 5-dehydrogenase n=1 Tax=Amycolatopsis suaedae TaxID=2510978 RepID=A0A4Q7JC57_9PSEU|nr:L-idonate 5-dehydrogenase [Amycolatopsis suaedae]RZQ64887.1 L-idonate 5-dehydrogenase [Amycolatopsis suaedae]